MPRIGNANRSSISSVLANGTTKPSRAWNPRRHVSEELGDPDGIFVVDGSGFEKKGTESCGIVGAAMGAAGQQNRQLPERESF